MSHELDSMPQPQYPQTVINKLGKKNLFTHQYNMMKAYLPDEETKRIIRKQVLIKYGRLLPLNYDFKIEGDKTAQLISPKQSDRSYRQILNRIKMPFSKQNQIMEGQLITKTNLLINQDDLLLAQNHSIYEKLAEHIAKTEKWEKVLLENNPNSDNNSNPNSNANPNLTPKTIQFSRRKKKKILMVPKQQLKFSLDLSPFQKQERKRTYSQDLYNNEVCQVKGKHLIMLKNLYAY